MLQVTFICQQMEVSRYQLGHGLILQALYTHQEGTRNQRKPPGLSAWVLTWPMSLSPNQTQVTVFISVWSNTNPQTGNVIHNGNESLTVPQISKIKTLTDQELGWWDFFVCHCLLILTFCWGKGGISMMSHFWKYCQAQGLCPRM